MKKNPYRCLLIQVVLILPLISQWRGKLGCKVLPIHEQPVSVADGKKVQIAVVCKNLKWLLQGTTFSSDFLLLPLREC